ncbi:MAG TPA: hypothetical protein VNZ58_03410 [Thermomicrobiales bacterium]|nr:hypothetical protein [Thermomicrobiales bacterium]
MATDIRPRNPDTSSLIDRLTNDIAHAEERRDEQVTKLKRQVALYERIYGLSSREMQAALQSGRLTENHDICEWLFHLDLLDHVASHR